MPKIDRRGPLGQGMSGVAEPPRQIVLKSRREIKKMKRAGELVAEAHRAVKALVRPGVTTQQIEDAVDDVFCRAGAEPLFLGVPCPEEGGPDYPAVTCISVEDEIVHGIPGPRELREGQIVAVDTGCRIDGWCGDSAWTYAVGGIDEAHERLMHVGRTALAIAIRGFATRSFWSEVAAEIQAYCEAEGCGVVRSLVGHAIGRELHEYPQVPNYVPGPEDNKEDDGDEAEDAEDHDFPLRPGLVLAIEPMINAGTAEVSLDDDDWTVRTEDGAPSVHFEHTVALTAGGPVLLTEGVGAPFDWESLAAAADR
ncbi:MAG: type I methionyl aminopeptidase [Planctomycetota bacterium]